MYLFNYYIQDLHALQLKENVATSCCSASRKLTVKGLFILEFQDYKKIFPYIFVRMALGSQNAQLFAHRFLSSYMKGNLAELVILVFMAAFLYIWIDLVLPLGVVLI